VPSPNTDFNAVSASYGHSLGLKNDGSIVAWGRNESGECDVPSPNTDFIAISAGYDFSLGLKSDGSVAGWGYNANGQYNVPSPNEDFASISAGTYHSLGLKGSNNVTVIQFGNIPGQKNTKLILTDCDGNNVTFSLTGGGYGEIDACDCTFSTITLFDTTEKSALTISTKGKVHTSVGNIICNGPMKSITAKTAKLSGDITIGSALNPKSAVTIAFDRTDDLDINSEMPIKSITATDWTGGSINAPSVSGIAIKGDKKRSIAGNLDIDVNVDGAIGTVNVAGWLESPWDCCSVKSITAFRAYDFYLTLHQKPDPKILALGKLTIKEGFYWSRIISSGNIGTFTVAAMRQSSCFAGVADACSVDLNADDVCDLPPVLDDTFNQTATIKSIMIKGIKGDDATYFVNSNIAAATVSSMSIAYPEYNNGGIPFGITMWNDPKAFTIKDANGTHSWKGSDIGTAKDWLTANGGDMQIRRD
jgi:hypothetical protein